MFFEIQRSNTCNFEDNHALYYCIHDLQTIIGNLTYDIKIVLT